MKGYVFVCSLNIYFLPTGIIDKSGRTTENVIDANRTNLSIAKAIVAAGANCTEDIKRQLVVGCFRSRVMQTAFLERFLRVIDQGTQNREFLVPKRIIFHSGCRYHKEDSIYLGYMVLTNEMLYFFCQGKIKPILRVEVQSITNVENKGRQLHVSEQQNEHLFYVSNMQAIRDVQNKDRELFATKRRSRGAWWSESLDKLLGKTVNMILIDRFEAKIPIERGSLGEGFQWSSNLFAHRTVDSVGYQ